jgi:hypothetical protein
MAPQDVAENIVLDHFMTYSLERHERIIRENARSSEAEKSAGMKPV